MTSLYSSKNITCYLSLLLSIEQLVLHGSGQFSGEELHNEDLAREKLKHRNDLYHELRVDLRLAFDLLKASNLISQFLLRSVGYFDSYSWKNLLSLSKSSKSFQRALIDLAERSCTHTLNDLIPM